MSTVTTTIVLVAWGATTANPLPVRGFAFLWNRKVRILLVDNYRFPRKPRFIKPVSDRSRTWGRGNEYTQTDNTTELSRRSVEIRVEIDHNIPGLRVFATWSQSGAMKAFHIEKQSGLPFDEGQLVATALR